MKVFISYAHTDEHLAEQVAHGLEENGLDVFLDEQQIMPGDNWAAKIAQGLQESQAMVVLLTRDALTSRRVRHDIDYALSNQDYSGRLIPVLAESKEALLKEDIPWILWHLKPITLTDHHQEEGIRQIAQVLKTAPKTLSR
ncbi:MAG TPA: toll/interleukin-1 receptor domain-containing protein [Herpetosiphonaceae bacterium]